jgi:ABC-2 type transport system ATP-binding protein
MGIIATCGLTKTYQSYEKEQGLKGSLRNLFNRKYRDTVAVDRLDISIDEGEMVGFLGPNGAGKTTIMKMLAGLIHPASGEARVMGYVPWERKKEFLRQYALVMGQKTQVWADLPAIETFHLCREIYQIERGKFSETLDELVDVLDVGRLLKTQVRRLSLGERMKMELIAALLHGPRVLFLDEPTIGLDVVSQGNIREFLRRHNRVHRTTVLLTSHYMRDIQDLCGRVVIVHQGRRVYDGELAKIVRRFSGQRELTLSFAAPVSEQSMSGLADVVRFDPLRVTLKMDRARLPGVIAEIVGTHDVLDISAGELPLEEVVSALFASFAAGSAGGVAP